MHVFWAKGYEGAALSDLTQAMRINRPSLYAAFGNKEQLFRKVLDRYASGPLAYFGQALEAPKARDVIEQIFSARPGWRVIRRLPAGCLMVQGALACGDSAGSVQKEAAARRAASRNCVASSPSTSKAGRRSSEKRRSSRTGPLRDDCAAGNGGPGSRRRQSRSITSSRANGTARVAEALA